MIPSHRALVVLNDFQQAATAVLLKTDNKNYLTDFPRANRLISILRKKGYSLERIYSAFGRTKNDRGHYYRTVDEFKQELETCLRTGGRKTGNLSHYAVGQMFPSIRQHHEDRQTNRTHMVVERDSRIFAKNYAREKAEETRQLKYFEKHIVTLETEHDAGRYLLSLLDAGVSEVNLKSLLVSFYRAWCDEGDWHFHVMLYQGWDMQRTAWNMTRL
ncbi:hypothetical protein [Enterovibrio calviensis]|uniref:hypothetical protein n=1 Tax=Enterovibrio calviensis TaxID=91359 RepID=UPI0037364CAD